MDPADTVDEKAVGHLVEVGDDHHLVAGVRVGLDAEPARQIHQRDEAIPQGEDPYHVALCVGIIGGLRHPDHLAHLGDVDAVVGDLLAPVRQLLLEVKFDDLELVGAALGQNGFTLFPVFGHHGDSHASGCAGSTRCGFPSV